MSKSILLIDNDYLNAISDIKVSRLVKYMDHCYTSWLTISKTDTSIVNESIVNDYHGLQRYLSLFNSDSTLKDTIFVHTPDKLYYLLSLLNVMADSNKINNAKYLARVFVKGMDNVLSDIVIPVVYINHFTTKARLKKNDKLGLEESRLNQVLTSLTKSADVSQKISDTITNLLSLFSKYLPFTPDYTPEPYLVLINKVLTSVTVAIKSSSIQSIDAAVHFDLMPSYSYQITTSVRNSSNKSRNKLSFVDLTMYGESKDKGSLHSLYAYYKYPDTYFSSIGCNDKILQQIFYALLSVIYQDIKTMIQTRISQLETSTSHKKNITKGDFYREILLFKTKTKE